MFDLVNPIGTGQRFWREHRPRGHDEPDRKSIDFYCRNGSQLSMLVAGR
jgi:hypothetical protein